MMNKYMMRIHEFKERTIAGVIAFVVLFTFCPLYTVAQCGDVGYNNYNNVDERGAKWHQIVRADEYWGRLCPSGNHSIDYIENNEAWWYELNDPKKDPNHKHLIEIIPTSGWGFRVLYYDESDSLLERTLRKRKGSKFGVILERAQSKTPFLDRFHILSIDGNGRPVHFE
ncbi:MAG: hypothetical protein LUD41_00325 [Phascolarctobacterium sp.]|nr:hypothetical protein [Phascolarctobacterium sp.]